MFSGAVFALHLVFASVVPTAQADAETPPATVDAPFSNQEMVDIFDSAALPNLAAVEITPPVTGIEAIDRRLITLAEARGYQARGVASGNLIRVDGYLLQPAAADAWVALRNAALAEGISISLTSGYRTPEAQAWLMNRELGGWTTPEINAALNLAAPPGYSKHHTGYAIDLRSGSNTLYDFADTAAYQWLAADGFANARAHGWLPSYPDGVEQLGPEPEPWEFVWVGVDELFCRQASPDAAGPFCDDDRSATTCASTMACPLDSTTKAHFAWLEAPRVLPVR